MKNKLVIVALIAVILAGGMVLISCGNCPGDGKCEYSLSGVMTGEWCDNAYTNYNSTDCFGSSAVYGAKCKC